MRLGPLAPCNLPVIWGSPFRRSLYNLRSVSTCQIPQCTRRQPFKAGFHGFMEPHVDPPLVVEFFARFISAASRALDRTFLASFSGCHLSSNLISSKKKYVLCRLKSILFFCCNFPAQAFDAVRRSIKNWTTLPVIKTSGVAKPGPTRA